MSLSKRIIKVRRCAACGLTVQETERLVADPAPGVQATTHEDNLRYFDVVVAGPSQSPFEGARLRGARTSHTCRRQIQARALPSRGLPDGATEGALPDEDLPPQYRCESTARARLTPADKLGRICLDILKGALRRHALLTCRQVVSCTADPHGLALYSSTSVSAESRRSPCQ